jgi:hypothetical protein
MLIGYVVLAIYAISGPIYFAFRQKTVLRWILTERHGYEGKEFDWRKDHFS